MNEQALDYFAKFVSPQENGCALWSGPKDKDGYGLFYRRGYSQRASRALWEMLFGPIPLGLLIMHTCDTPSCVEITHLRLGTSKENTQDMVQKGRAKGGRPPSLTKEQIRAIRLDPRSQSELAEVYGKNQATISRIKNGKLRYSED